MDNPLFFVFLTLSYEDLNKICIVSTVCDNPLFWQYKAYRDFGILTPTFNQINIAQPRAKYVYLMTAKPDQGLADSARWGQQDLANYFISQGATNFDTSLGEAVKSQDLAMVEFVANKGVSHQGYNNALFIAASESNSPLIGQYLISHGANNYKTCLAVARLAGNENMVELLKKF